VSEVCDSIEEGSAALILAEEALNSKSIPAIIETLERQSSWSNLPITIVTSGGEATQSRLRSLGAFGHARNVTILERPFRPSTLISTVEVALNARRRQYQVRDLLFNLQASEAHLKRILESISDGFARLIGLEVYLCEYQLREADFSTLLLCGRSAEQEYLGTLS
jgi:hypothetical protein